MTALTHEATYYGPNPCAEDPVLVMELRLNDELAGKVDLLCNALRAAYPDWLIQAPDSSCPPATRMALAMAQWALSALNAKQGYLHVAGSAPSPAGAYVWVGFHDAALSRNALQLALEAILRPDREKNRLALESLWQMCDRHHPNEQSMILMQAARAKDIPVMRFAHGRNTWQYGWGKRSSVFSGAASNTNGSIGQHISSNKADSKIVFAALGFPVAVHCLVTKASELEWAAKIVGWPCVSKPIDRGQGKGVTAGIHTPAQLAEGLAYAQRYTHNPVMIEAFVSGDTHRLMVVGGRLIAAISRKPPIVEGDGQSTVAQLLVKLNADRAADKVASRFILQVQADAAMHQHLARMGLTFDSVLPAGQPIALRSNSNRHSGGTCEDVTDRVHPHVRQASEMISESLGLPLMGLDYITTDISKSWQEGGVFLETNSSPGLGAEIVAGYDPVKLGELILGNQPARIPLTLAVVPQAELHAVQQHIQQASWPTGSGWVCGMVGCIGDAPLKFTVDDSWHAAQGILRHQALEALLIICGDQDLMRHGMPCGRVERVLLCNEVLAAQWQEALSRNTAQLDLLPHWESLASHISNHQEQTKLT